ncbi:glutamate--tRNA ligase [Bacteroidia bacterium]|nr:glutamate--tRNA ligase [Bacteroidia bacterium]
MNKVRTRFAPSPTGFMHIGNLRTALYCYLYAKKNKGAFILRIEDTDQERQVENAVETIYKTMQLAGMQHDEGPDVGGDFGPYVQSERKEVYARYAKELVAKGHAYYCFCTKERLDTLMDSDTGNRRYDKHCLHLTKEEIAENLAAGIPYVIRQNVPLDGTTTFSDLVYGDITVDNKELQDNVLLKSDGLPTYNFANVVDDHLMAISHVFRGMEYLSSTPNYNLLYQAFGWQLPQYIHLPHIMRDKQHKLSKRDGDANFEDFLNKGFLPDAILNYVSLLGWNPKNDREKFTLDELVEHFDIAGISKSPAIFDEVKLRWLNSLYIKELPFATFQSQASTYYNSVTVPLEPTLLGQLLQSRISAFSDIPATLQFIDRFDAYDLELFEHSGSKSSKELAKSILPTVIAATEKVESWNNELLFETFVKVGEQFSLKNKQLLWIIRIAITGHASTPGGATEICVLLGKELTLKRLKASLERL